MAYSWEATNLYNEGIAHYKRGEYELAIVDLNRAIELNPEYMLANFYIGRAYYQKREFDRAIESFGRYIRVKPTDAITYHDRGLAYGMRRK